MTSNSCSTFNIGDVVTFGAYQWRALDVSGGKALIITENIAIEDKHPYNKERKDITWEQCTLRAYLNGVFYNRFTEADKARILETEVKNDKNPWFGTNGGKNTKDKIFLLSLEEVVKSLVTAGSCGT